MDPLVSANAFQWSVLLPEQRSSSLSGGPRPKATLVFSTPERGEERLNVPLVVGKALQAEQDAGKRVGNSRAELLYHLRELSSRHASLRVERLINKRDYSSQELDEKLRMDGYHHAVREWVIGRAIDCGLVNDDRYASVFIRGKLASGWGTARIEHELMRKGIDASKLPGWPSAYLDGEDEDARALAVARTRRISDKRGYEKLVRFLCNRGYSLGCSIRVAQQVVDESRAQQ